MSSENEAKRLADERMKLVKAERDLADSIKAGDTADAETLQRLDQYASDIASIEANIRRITDVEKRDRDTAALAEYTGQVFGSQAAIDHRDESEAERLRQWLNTPENQRGDLNIDISAARREREMLRAGYSAPEIQNALISTGSIGSAVPTTMARSLYEFMEANIAALRVGAEVINTSSGENLEFPYVASHSVATQVATESTVIAGTDPTFEKLTLGANRYGEIVTVSNAIVEDAVFDIGGFLGRNMGRAVGRLVDQHMILGTGSITGAMIGSSVTASSGLGTVATGSIGGTLVPTASSWLFDAVHAIPDAYRGPGCAWLFKDSTIAAIRKLRDGAGGTEGAYLWEPSRTAGLINGQPDTLLGFPVYGDPFVAALGSNFAVGGFGDWSTYYVRQAGSVQIDATTERYFDTDQVGYRAKIRLDAGYIDANGVVIVKQRAA